MKSQKKLTEAEYGIYVTPSVEIRWQGPDDKKRIFTSAELADHLLKELLERIEA